MFGNITVEGAVLKARLFYKGSTRFNVTNNNLPGFSDDNAIAPDKTAYLPGGGSRDLLGRVQLLARYQRPDGRHGQAATARSRPTTSPSRWVTTTRPVPGPRPPRRPPSRTRSGAGASGSDRVELMWANNAIQKQWLEVIVEGNDALGGFNTNTGLASRAMCSTSAMPWVTPA